MNTSLIERAAPRAGSAPNVESPQLAALADGGISLAETARIALKSLVANKLRTLLTALGIIIGVAAVVGLRFGIAPARSAARLDPIDALRYD